MDIENLIFRCLERFWSSKYNERYGVVTSYDPEKHAAKVKIQPSGQETGWIPIHAHHVGNGWGVMVGLQVGDQVKLSHQEGDFEVAEVTNRVHSDEDKPPKVESGEILFKHKDGGSIKFDKDKNITWAGANGQVIKTDKDGNCDVTLKTSTNSSASKKGRFTVDVDDGKHAITIDPQNGIKHKSILKVTIEAQQIEHSGNVTVSGSILTSGVVQSNTGFKGNLEGLSFGIGFLGGLTDATGWS